MFQTYVRDFFNCSHNKSTFDRKAMQADVRRRLESVQKGDDEENQSCFDCAQSGPTWASVNNGVFLCLSCVRVHKTFGSVVSDVRSVVLDAWSQPDVAAVEAGGEGNFSSRGGG
jgi:hypothetical protein